MRYDAYSPLMLIFVKIIIVVEFGIIVMNVLSFLFQIQPCSLLSTTKHENTKKEEWNSPDQKHSALKYMRGYIAIMIT